MSGARFVRFYPSDWRSGCIGMSFEQEGFYVRVCAFIYETNKRLPFDDSAAAKLIGANTNAYRKLRTQLVASGKIKRCGDGYTVPRAEKELAAATYSKGQQERQVNQDAERETGKDAVGLAAGVAGVNAPIDTPLEFSENGNEINGPLKSLKPIANSLEEKKEQCSSAQHAAKPLPRIDTDKLIAACNGALDNPVNCLGLLSAATPIMWLETGCDMDRDIIPTLQAMGKKYHGKRIRSWEYFSGAIQDARNRRLHGATKAAADESEIQLRAIKAIVGSAPARKLKPDLSNEMMPTDA